MPDILFIETCDFEHFPVGGGLSFAKQMMAVFGNRLALVGFSTDGTPVGRWVTKQFNGLEYEFMAIGRRVPSGRRPLVPARATAYLDVARHKRAIMSRGIRCVFTQSPETLMAIHAWPWDSICFMFPGHANPLKMPRYRWAKPLAGLYDAKLSAALQDVDVILACADADGIRDIAGRSKGLLSPDRIVQFPTRVDTSIFKPQPVGDARRKLGLDGPGPLVVTCGRISEVKGWDLLISAFPYFMRTYSDARLIFVGDGEDRPALQQTIARHDLTRSVSLAGFQPPGKVADYLNAADLVVVGSYKEGWSVAMLEALACAQVVVSTEVSGARDLIKEGQNGRVVQGRDPKRFAAAMTEALEMERPNPVSLKIAERYSLTHLRRDMSLLWEPLADPMGAQGGRLDGPPAGHQPLLSAGRGTEQWRHGCGDVA